MKNWSQYQHWNHTAKRLAERNEMFLFFVADGLRRSELAACIDRRPSVWGAYAGWLNKLPA